MTIPSFRFHLTLYKLLYIQDALITTSRHRHITFSYPNNKVATPINSRSSPDIPPRNIFLVSPRYDTSMSFYCRTTDFDNLPLHLHLFPHVTPRNMTSPTYPPPPFSRGRRLQTGQIPIALNGTQNPLYLLTDRPPSKCLLTV